MKTLCISQLNFKNKFNLVTPCSEIPIDSSVYLRFITKPIPEEPNLDIESESLEGEQQEPGVTWVPMEYPKGRRDAISVRNAYKAYGKRGKDPQRILHKLNMTVQEGTIYTLLGSSGCGKTTLLQCIVGMIKLDSGDVRIFNKRPGTKASGVPGKRVGFMPQENALYDEFTIREAMKYFGRINGMDAKRIEERTDFLVQFLHLPEGGRIIRTLSGGQKRRVSFAVALLHEPQILILDEPTVGVDPVLRRDIWNHLRMQAEAKGTTVIITTHYMEEAQTSARIGLMRSGRLLAEAKPQVLMERFKCSKMEDVFYKLCRRDEARTKMMQQRLLDNLPGGIIVNSEDMNKRRTSSSVDPSSPPPPPPAPPTSPASEPEDGIQTPLGSDEEEQESDSSEETVALGNNSENGSVEVFNENEKSGRGGARSPTSPTTPTFNRSVEHLITETSPPMNNGSGGVNNNKGSEMGERVVRGSGRKKRRTEVDHENNKKVKEEEADEEEKDMMKHRWTLYDKDDWNIMWALLLKNFLCMWRNMSFVVFIFFLPAVQAILFCLAIGGEPTKLPLGVINYEVPETLTNCSSSRGCSLINMSCNFVSRISNQTITLKRYFNESHALDDVKRGEIWGYFTIPKNFSDAMVLKGVGGGGTTASGMYEEGFKGMHVTLSLDMTSQQISYQVEKTISVAFAKFVNGLTNDCGINETLDVPPSSFAQPIYGGNHSSFREFMAPGIILSIIFFMSVALTGSAFITEKREGMLVRTMISGVTTGQIITAHMVTQYLIMMGQTVLVLIVMLIAFNIQIEGSTTLVVVLTLVQGTCGMAYGFLISVLCNNERNAIQMALGSFYPNLLLSGVVWPLESIPDCLRNIAVFLPQTMACEAMRSIFSRAWPLLHPKVWPGFASSFAWSFVFWILALIIARTQKK